MGRLTTHVLDTVKGRPADGVGITLHRLSVDGTWTIVKTLTTNADGRTDEPLLIGAAFVPGTYMLSFAIGDYFRRTGAPAADPPFLDIVPVRFHLAEGQGHYHVPLLASPWSYSTYRGS